MNTLTIEERFNVVVNHAFCGWNHVSKQEKRFNDAAYFTVYQGGFSTYDFDQLTKLVLAAHAMFLRAEIVQSGPQRIGVWLSKRAPAIDGDSFADRHPSLDDLIKQASELKAKGWAV